MPTYILLNSWNQGCQHCVLKKSENFTKCLTYALPQEIGPPRHKRRSKIESKFLNSRVLAAGFVTGCAKKVMVLSIYKNVVENSAV